ncbi:MAG: peptidase C39 family protein [Nitrososphaerota archaeon]|nr:peptidase C39 family protein [Nitrososphaerota archaeon]
MMENMRMTWGESIRLKVRSYRQHYDFTCGPASLMMAMKYHDEGMQLSKELEIDIWREASMVELYGTSRYGLAYSAAVRGFEVKVLSNLKGYGFVDKLKPSIEGMDRQMLRLLFEERRRRCMSMGVGEEIAEITPEILREALLSGLVPVLLTSTEWFSREDLPHWVVVTGFNDDVAYLNDPLGGRKSARIAVDSLQRILGYKGDKCAVVIGKRSQRPAGDLHESQKRQTAVR